MAKVFNLTTAEAHCKVCKRFVDKLLMMQRSRFQRAFEQCSIPYSMKVGDLHLVACWRSLGQDISSLKLAQGPQ
jgi:hypothetical protein